MTKRRRIVGCTKPSRSVHVECPSQSSRKHYTAQTLSAGTFETCQQLILTWITFRQGWEDNFNTNTNTAVDCVSPKHIMTIHEGHYATAKYRHSTHSNCGAAVKTRFCTPHTAIKNPFLPLLYWHRWTAVHLDTDLDTLVESRRAAFREDTLDDGKRVGLFFRRHDLC